MLPHLKVTQGTTQLRPPRRAGEGGPSDLRETTISSAPSDRSGHKSAQTNTWGSNSTPKTLTSLIKMTDRQLQASRTWVTTLISSLQTPFQMRTTPTIPPCRLSGCTASERKSRADLASLKASLEASQSGSPSTPISTLKNAKGSEDHSRIALFRTCKSAAQAEKLNFNSKDPFPQLQPHPTKTSN